MESLSLQFHYREKALKNKADFVLDTDHTEITDSFCEKRIRNRLVRDIRVQIEE
jgi:hypothetical protein